MTGSNARDVEDVQPVGRVPAQSGDPAVMQVFGACIVDYGDFVTIHPNTAASNYNRERLYKFTFGGTILDA